MILEDIEHNTKIQFAIFRLQLQPPIDDYKPSEISLVQNRFHNRIGYKTKGTLIGLFPNGGTPNHLRMDHSYSYKVSF